MERRNNLFSKANKKIPANTEILSIRNLKDDADDFIFMEETLPLEKL